MLRFDNKDILSKILNGKDSQLYFGDHPSLTWRQGRNNLPAKSAFNTNNDANKQIDWLFAHSRGAPKLQLLAQKLDACSHKARCISGACLMCSRAATRAFVKEVSLFMAESEYDFVVLNICHPSFAIPLNKMDTFKLAQIKSSLDILLEKCGFSIAFGGIDCSFNEARVGSKALFMPHAWIFVLKHEYRRCGKRLRKILQKIRSDAVPRPLWSRDFDGDIRALAYALKNTFNRRVGYTCSKSGRKNTRTRPLRVEHKIALALFLDGEPLAARFYFYEKP